MVFVSPATFNHFYTFAKEAVLTVNNFFQRNSRSLGELRSKKTIVEQVALSVQASQNEQNNGVKHLETVSSTLFTLNFVYFKLCLLEWRPAPVPLKNNPRATSGM